jgi:hypothetical protein
LSEVSIQSIEYNDHAKSNLVNKASKIPNARSRRGRQDASPELMAAKTVVGEIHLSNGKSFSIPACVPGHLLELNEELVQNPKLAQTHPMTKGYLFVIKPKITKLSHVCDLKDYMVMHPSWDSEQYPLLAIFKDLVGEEV